jgi:hypothetical protein
MATYKVQRLFGQKVSEEDKKKLSKADAIENLSYLPALAGGGTAIVGMHKGINPWNKTTKAGLASMAIGTAGVVYGDHAQRKIYNKYHRKQAKSVDPGLYGGTSDIDGILKVNQWVRKNKK